MGPCDILEITLTFKAFGLGFVFQPEWKSYTIYLGVLSITLNTVKKEDDNKWISFAYAGE